MNFNKELTALEWSEIMPQVFPNANKPKARDLWEKIKYRLKPNIFEKRKCILYDLYSYTEEYPKNTDNLIIEGFISLYGFNEKLSLSFTNFNFFNLKSYNSFLIGEVNTRKNLEIYVRYVSEIMLQVATGILTNQSMQDIIIRYKEEIKKK